MDQETFSRACTGFFTFLSVLKSREIEIGDIYGNNVYGISKVDGLFGTEIKKDHMVCLELDKTLSVCTIYFHPDYFEEGRKITNMEEKVEILREEYGSDDEEIISHMDDDLYDDEQIFSLDQEGVRKFSIKIKDLL